MNINYFENARSKTPRTTTLDRVVASLHNSLDLQAKTDEYRDALRHDPDTAAQMKRSFGAFLPAALVGKSRKRDNVTALTGLMMCDFDHVPAERLAELRQKANDDPHTVLTYVTLSGGGLRVLAAYEVPELMDEKEPEKFPIAKYEKFYHGMFAAINRYYGNLLGQKYDEACKDLTRLSFVAFDAEAFFRPEATPFKEEEAGIENDRIRKDKKDSRRKKNKETHQIERCYKRQIKPMLATDGEVYKPHNHNRYVMRTAFYMNKFGFNVENVLEWALKEFADYDNVESVVRSCFNHTEEHGEWADRLTATYTGDENKPKHATYGDIIHFVFEKADVRRNLIKGMTEMRWKKPPYEGKVESQHSHDRRAYTHDIDAMVKTMVCQLSTERGLETSKEKIYDVVESDAVEEYDPLLDYLEHLPEWVEGRDPDYIGELADTVRVIDVDPAAQDLFRRCLEKWLVAMLVGWTHPKEVNQTILTFIGAQGTYKSTWMKHLMPPELNEYFKIKQNAGEVRTDDLITMSRFGLILHEEMDAMTARENNTMKAMITAQHSDERAPYGRTPRRRHNIASLCATGNNEEFLSNEQGTRRNLVFRVEVAKSPIDYPFNYDGIYAQAYARMKSGFQYYFNKEEQRELEAHNRQFEVANSEDSAIEAILRQPEGEEVPVWMRPSQIAELLSQRSGCHARYRANMISQAMKRMGFKSTYRRGNIGYLFVIRDFNEVDRFRKSLALEPESFEQPSLQAGATDGTNVITDPALMPEQAQELFRNVYGDDDDDNEREIDYGIYND